MKNRIKQITLICFVMNGLISCSQNKNGKTNKIKSYSEVSYNAEKQNGVIEKTKKSEEKKVYHYNEKEQLVKYELHFNHHGEQMVTSELYSYDKKENLVQTKKMNGTNTNTYNNKGLLIESIEQYTTGHFKSRGTYKYDKMGNTTEYNSFNKDGNVENTVLTTYNEKGNKTELLFYDASKKLSNKYVIPPAKHAEA